jgi:hypothetical protein
LEELSRDTDARAILDTLRRDIMALAPTYSGLAAVFETDLLALIYSSAEATAIRLHLERHWFDAPAATAYFAGAVAEIYAKGVLNALDLALNGSPSDRPPLGIDAWWLVDHAKVEMVTTRSPGSDRLTLQVLTPRPAGAAAAGTPILGRFSAAWVTADVAGAVTTGKFAGDSQAPRRRR